MALSPLGGVRSRPRLLKLFFLSFIMVFVIAYYLLLRNTQFNRTVSTHYKELTENVWFQMHINLPGLSDDDAELLKRPEAVKLIEQHEAAGLSRDDILSETLRILAEYNRADRVWEQGGIIEQHRRQFEEEYKALDEKTSNDALYHTTLEGLVVHDAFRSPSHNAALKPTNEIVSFGFHRPFVYDPYQMVKQTPGFVPCEGPDGVPMEDIKVFKGSPPDFPKPSFGSYEVLAMDDNLCYERQTRLEPYGYGNASKFEGANWGLLQNACVGKNMARFNQPELENPYLHVYSKGKPKPKSKIPASNAKYEKPLMHRAASKVPRTAVLLRAWTGKEYTENDILIIRSLVTELNLQTGGQYQVFLLVHDKDNDTTIWHDEDAYKRLLRESVPPEFVNMSILWNDAATQATYPKIFPTIAVVHTAQWLSVQIFSQQHPEFEYIWNRELDSRLIGHQFDFHERLAGFARKQPRRGLWERSERYYIPSLHGDYDTKFRKDTEARTGYGIWGPPKLSYIKPIGPEPPVSKPEYDNFHWGVGEEADLITLGPIIDAQETEWIIKDQVWGFNGVSTPRRGTIITQARVSKRLLDIMHVENLRGNHVSSEMTPQTVALHHGLKAVYAPMPVFFNLPWTGKDLERWFNCGFSCGKDKMDDNLGSPMDWGREGRFSGSTWYYRATPPEILYRNWMGWESSGIGGQGWENQNGRYCLPPVLLHPVKDTKDPESGK